MSLGGRGPPTGGGAAHMHMLACTCVKSSWQGPTGGPTGDIKKKKKELTGLLFFFFKVVHMQRTVLWCSGALVLGPRGRHQTTRD